MRPRSSLLMLFRSLQFDGESTIPPRSFLLSRCDYSSLHGDIIPPQIPGDIIALHSHFPAPSLTDDHASDILSI